MILSPGAIMDSASAISVLLEMRSGVCVAGL